MIQWPPTPIDSLVQALQALIDASVRQPDRRMLAKTYLNGIAGATRELWHYPAMERADRRRLMREALAFYAGGGKDDGQRARAVFAIMEGDRAEYWRPLSTAAGAPRSAGPGGEEEGEGES